MSYNMRHALNTMFCLLSVSCLVGNLFCSYTHTTIMLTVCSIDRQPGRGYHYSKTKACDESTASKNVRFEPPLTKHSGSAYVCAYAQTRQGLLCSHAQHMVVEGDSDKNIIPLAHLASMLNIFMLTSTVAWNFNCSSYYSTMLISFKLPAGVFIMLINVKMPTIVGILTFMSMIKRHLRIYDISTEISCTDPCKHNAL